MNNPRNLIQRNQAQMTSCVNSVIHQLSVHALCTDSRNVSFYDHGCGIASAAMAYVAITNCYWFLRWKANDI
eukprot:scaffold554570_cov16-Prasinocladus_malaysianus.AAC.1